MREYYSLTFPPPSMAMYSFIQLSELGRCGENKNAQTSKAPLIASPAFYRWATACHNWYCTWTVELRSTVTHPTFRRPAAVHSFRSGLRSPCATVRRCTAPSTPRTLVPIQGHTGRRDARRQARSTGSRRRSYLQWRRAGHPGRRCGMRCRPPSPCLVGSGPGRARCSRCRWTGSRVRSALQAQPWKQHNTG